MDIKFRVWTDEAKMIGPFDLSQNPNYWEGLRDGIRLMYTGVRVNRDQELYVGDIVPVKVSVYLGWKQGRYEFKRNAVLRYCKEDMCCKFYAHTPYGLQSVNFDKSIRQSYRIIGNIYENPELMEEGTENNETMGTK